MSEMEPLPPGDGEDLPPNPDVGKILSAFPVDGGIQVNRLVSDTRIACTMFYPGQPGWDEAAAAAGYFEDPTLEPAPPPDVSALRAKASLPRAEFLLRCVSVGILTQQEALVAAGGGIPESFAAFINEWSPEYVFEAQLRWAALTQVDRLNPLITMLAAQRGITDEQLDVIFGLVP